MSVKILAIDTTEAGCSAALLDGEEIIERYELAPRRHSELLLPMIDGLLGEAGVGLSQLDALAFARGPGSFTGVRIATAAIQGLATAADRPVLPISSLRALAQGAVRAHQAERVLAGFDARMGEVYALACEVSEGLAQPVAEEQVCSPDEWASVSGEVWFAIGSAWQAYAEALDTRFAAQLSGRDAAAQVHAQDVARLAAADFAAGLAVSAEHALPVYLRDQVAKKMSAR